MYYQAVSAAKDYEQKQVVVGYSRSIDTSDWVLINLSTHFHHRIPALLAKFHPMYICGACYFYHYPYQACYLSLKFQHEILKFCDYLAIQFCYLTLGRYFIQNINFFQNM